MHSISRLTLTCKSYNPRSPVPVILSSFIDQPRSLLRRSFATAQMAAAARKLLFLGEVKEAVKQDYPCEKTKQPSVRCGRQH